MAFTKSVQFPRWLDDIIYNEFGAVYEQRPIEVEYNPDQPFEFVRLYLGTYFPRSYAEAYCILSRLFDNPLYKNELSVLEEINILDFCCGTGGEIVGLIHFLNDNLSNLKRVNIDAFDANPDAIRFLFHLMKKINNAPEMRLSINIVPQGLFIENENDMRDFINIPNSMYHFVVSFKALNEFVQSNTFPNSNVYDLVPSYLLPLLDNKGVLIISDLTHQYNGIYYPSVMTNGLNTCLRRNNNYKTIIPSPCFHYEKNCKGCYLQESFYVTHSHKTKDRSKVAYRVICKSDFAQHIMQTKAVGSCRHTDANADKSLPYHI